MNFPTDEQSAIARFEAHFFEVNAMKNIIVDEVHIQSSGLRLAWQPQEGTAPHVDIKDTNVTLMMTETNVNRLIAAYAPAEGLAKELQITLLTGRMMVSGKIKFGILHATFQAKVIPTIRSGTRIWLDILEIKSIAPMPPAAREMIEKQVNEQIPLEFDQLPFPVFLDEIRCEPGRITCCGRLRFNWPFIERADTIMFPFTVLPPAAK